MSKDKEHPEYYTNVMGFSEPYRSRIIKGNIMSEIEQKEKVANAISEFMDRIATVQLWDQENPYKHPGITQKMNKAWVSKTDESFLCYKDYEYIISFLFHNNISENIQAIEKGGPARIGFSPTKQKWFAFTPAEPFPWCEGFGIGDSVTRVDIGYRPSCEKEWKEMVLDDWNDEGFAWTTVNSATHESGARGILIKSGYGDDPPSEMLRDATVEKFFPFPAGFEGKGEWMAETLDDAKQMAIDFVRAVL